MIEPHLIAISCPSHLESNFSYACETRRLLTETGSMSVPCNQFQTGHLCFFTRYYSAQNFSAQRCSAHYVQLMPLLLAACRHFVPILCWLSSLSIQLHSADVHLICLHIGLGITADEYLLYCPEENVVL